MAQTQDGNFTTAFLQNGAPQIDFPLQAQGEYYARTIKRRLSALWPYYVPVVGARTSYTNLLLYSEVFDNAAWNKTDTTITADSVANPADGTVNADLLTEGSAGTANVNQVITTTAGVSYAVTLPMKRGNHDWVRVIISDSTFTDGVNFWFNLATGAVGATSVAGTGVLGSINIYPLGNGWYWLACILTVGNGRTSIAVLTNSASANSSMTRVNNGTRYQWGADFKLASAVGPYIPTTTVARTISAPNVDFVDAVAIQSTANAALAPGDCFAYCVDEPTPDSSGLARGFAEWTRLYARIPKDVTVYSTIAVTKPTPSSLGTLVSTLYDFTAGLNAGVLLASGGYYYLSYLWINNQVYTQKTAASSITPASSGTFTVTFGANTTANLNWNDSGATIATAINALASVIAAGITVTVNNALNQADPLLTLTLTVGSTASRFTMTTTNLNAGSKFAFTSYVSVTTQNLRIGFMATITGHGFATSGNLAGINGSSSFLFAYTTGWVVVDANTIAYNGSIGQSPQVGSITSAGPLYRTYTPGVDRLRTKRVTSYYLPGVTAGITTPADIPVPDPALNDAVFLSLVITYLTGFQTYDADPLALWLGPIYQQTLIQIDMTTV